MLAHFSMKNVLSFKDETTLNLSTVPAYKQHPYNLIHGTQCDFVRFAAIYGANASGKSNLYYGIRMFRDIVTNSMNTVGDVEDNVLMRCYHPFAFEDMSLPSQYQIIICSETNEYRYGFEFTDEKIVSEWLYKKDYSSNRKSLIIERSDDSITIGASIRRECEKYKAQIMPETLALSFFSRLALKTDIFIDIYSEIARMMVIDTEYYEKRRAMERLLPDVIDKQKNDLIKYLTAIDAGINDISYDTIDRRIEFFTYHIGKDKEKHRLNLYDESQGTLKSIIIFIIASSVIHSGGIMIVDELNIKLHPLLLKFVIELFKNEKSKAQLIYTTHDTTLLDTKFFRRDQVWFVEKDEFGYSKLMALSDFKIRSDASFEKDYLSGVFGGIPTLLDYTMETSD